MSDVLSFMTHRQLGHANSVVNFDDTVCTLLSNEIISAVSTVL